MAVLYTPPVLFDRLSLSIGITPYSLFLERVVAQPLAPFLKKNYPLSAFFKPAETTSQILLHHW